MLIPCVSPPSPSPALLSPSRRNLLLTLSITWAHLSVTSPSHSRGLFRMPPPRLANRYFLVRSGESTFETAGVIRTNPVSKTSVDSGLSADGLRQTARAALELKRLGACEDDCWIWPSITQRAYQAAEIIASVNGVNYRFISDCLKLFLLLSKNHFPFV